MLKNWFIIQLRHFTRNKINTIVNVFGLSVGMFVFVLIFLFVRHELSYDNFHKDRDQIFRILSVNDVSESNFMGNNLQASLPALLSESLKDQASGLEAVSRMSFRGIVTAKIAGKNFYEDQHYLADSDLFNILTFDILRSNSKDILKNPRTIALSESSALKYFGTTDVLGREIDFTNIKDLGTYTVDAVFKDFPSNSSFRFNIIFNLTDYANTIQANDLTSWQNWNYNFFVKLTDKKQSIEFEETVSSILKDKNENNKGNNYVLESFSNLYLSSKAAFSVTPSADLSKIYILSIIGIFVLIMACVNYVSLVTAQAFNRAKEVGIRKVSGAMRGNLVYQFITETLVLNCAAMIVAVAAVWLVFPLYRDFIGKEIPFNIFGDNFILGSIIVVPVFFGLLSGIYPALILSSYKPVKILKGTFARTREGSSLRNALTIFQFALTGLLIIGTVVLNRQMHFIEINDPGYQREHIVRVTLLDKNARDKFTLIQTALETDSRIIATSVSTALPNYVGALQTNTWKNQQGEFDISIYSASVDEHFTDLFDLKILEGRGFSDPKSIDRNTLLINETAAMTYGWANPVGMEFIETQTNDTLKIIGVVKDFHIASYREPIRPLCLKPLKSSTFAFNLSIKIKPDDIPGTLKFIEDTYNKFSSGNLPYKYAFFDDQFNNAYKQDQQLSKMITVFSFLALIIACMGLYSLSTYNIAMRLKEIGVRKVLGAAKGQLVYKLIHRQFLLILISFIVACPIAYFSANEWLNEFAYHIELTWMIFISALLFLLTISISTIGIQTWKATLLNPVDVLRNE